MPVSPPTFSITFCTSLNGMAGPDFELGLTTLNERSGGRSFSLNSNSSSHSPLGLPGTCVARALTLANIPVASRRLISAATALLVEVNPGVRSPSPKISSSVGTPAPLGRPEAVSLARKKASGASEEEPAAGRPLRLRRRLFCLREAASSSSSSSSSSCSSSSPAFAEASSSSSSSTSSYSEPDSSSSSSSLSLDAAARSETEGLRLLLPPPPPPLLFPSPPPPLPPPPPPFHQPPPPPPIEANRAEPKGAVEAAPRTPTAARARGCCDDAAASEAATDEEQDEVDDGAAADDDDDEDWWSLAEAETFKPARRAH